MDALVLTCEHGGNRIPARYAPLFSSRRAQAALASHRGFDLGALALARVLSRQLGVPLIFSDISRLLVELNRSMGHPRLFSEFSRNLDEDEKRRIVTKHYTPHRARVEQAVRSHVLRKHRTLHLSVHSFTPVFEGKTRSTDIGLLYDPRRPLEREWCGDWKAAFSVVSPSLGVRRNYPYRGKNDGLTTALRKVFESEHYLGIELETNQALLTGSAAGRRRAAESIVKSLEAALVHQSRT